MDENSIDIAVAVPRSYGGNQVTDNNVAPAFATVPPAPFKVCPTVISLSTIQTCHQ